MRILHTSDWHLGQHFMGQSREAEHQAFLAWLLETVEEKQINAIIIAGDVFDTTIPPSSARQRYYEFIVALQNSSCRHLIVLGGNHDSVAMLNESATLLSHLNTTVISSVLPNPNDQVITLNDHNGEAAAIVCAIPYIRAKDILESQSGESGSEKQIALQQTIATHYQRVFDIARQKSTELAKENRTLPVIATGHLTAVGSKLSESVRDIYIGTLAAFPTSAFPEADYIALGHIHRPQLVGGHEHIRYSGSPIPLSFDETHIDADKGIKQVVLIEFNNSQAPTITSMPLPVFRPLFTLRGMLDELPQQIENILPQLNDTTLTPWFDVEVDDQAHSHDLPVLVEQIFDQYLTDYALLRIRKKRRQANIELNDHTTHDLSELDVNEVFQQRLAQEAFSSEQITALSNAFQEVLASLHEESEAV